MHQVCHSVFYKKVRFFLNFIWLNHTNLEGMIIIMLQHDKISNAMIPIYNNLSSFTKQVLELELGILIPCPMCFFIAVLLMENSAFFLSGFSESSFPRHLCHVPRCI